MTSYAFRFGLLNCCLLVLLSGCGGGNQKAGGKEAAATDGKSGGTDGEQSRSKRKKYTPVTIGDGTATIPDATEAPPATISNEKQMESIVEALQPFQILLGKWTGITRKKFEGFAKNEELEWVWDFKTDKSQPSLAFHSDKSIYFRDGWITYLPAKQKFRFTGVGPEGEKRVFEGTWADGGEPKETYEGKKTERSYKLRLPQVAPTDGDQWQVVFNHQENNRYLVELTKKAPGGNTFGPLDTVGAQRLGTSFAVADSDNPGPKCIISGGLGSMTVTYKGKSYPVCCSGCAAAFNEEPERWLAKLAKAEAAKKKTEN